MPKELEMCCFALFRCLLLARTASRHTLRSKNKQTLQMMTVNDDQAAAGCGGGHVRLIGIMYIRSCRLQVTA